MADPLLRVEREHPVARVVLDNPKRRNVLSLAMMQDLTDELRMLGGDAAVQVVVIESSGSVFSAGHDLAEMQGKDLEFYEQLFDACTELMETLHAIPQPVIAKVGGVATAAGCQLVASCDLVVATEESAFATPGVKIGLFCSTPMVPISRAVGRKRAMEMLLTGDMIDAHTAADWGLVNRVVPASELDKTVADLADRIAGFSPYVVGVGKVAFYAQVDRDEPGAYELTKQVMATNATADDAQEGFDAFLHKREPRWSGS